MELEILGSGTSHGIPVIGCNCPVCTSGDPRDSRMRASALIRADDGTTVLIDAGPEFRIQALRARLSRLDAVLITHSHADHIHGLDDIRIFSTEKDMPVYADKACTEDIRQRFNYIFSPTQEGGGKPHLELIAVGQPAGCTFLAAGIRITPIPLMHGELPILGWRVGDTAYLTDCNRIPDESYPLLAGVRNLVIDALRERPHSTHFSFSQALDEIRRINPERAWFTHICHDFSHAAMQTWIAGRTEKPDSGLQGKKIEPAHDGLRITIRQ